MSEKAFCVVTSDHASHCVYLYTHWDAIELPEIVRSALDSDAGRGRWDHDEYLCRIIFEAMLENQTDSQTGYGIGVCAPIEGKDAAAVYNYFRERVVLVDIEQQQVSVIPGPNCHWTYSFQEYCDAGPFPDGAFYGWGGG